jgi:hypothetical protein
VQKSGQLLAGAQADRAVDGEDADAQRARADRAADLNRALSPLRDWKVQRATRRGAFAGLGLGVVAFTVVGAVLGSALPGAGTVGGAVVGGLVGSFLFGGGIGNAAGKWQAGRMTVDSVAQDFAPRIGKIAKLARKAGSDAGPVTDRGRERITRALTRILSSQAKHGHPLTPAFVEDAQSALIRLEMRRELLPGEKQAVRKRLRQMLGQWTSARHAVDAQLIQRAVDALADARLAARAAMPKQAGAPGVNVIGDADRWWAIEALDATVIARVRLGYEVGDAFTREAAHAFADIYASNLAADHKKAAADQLRDIMAQGERLAPTALRTIAQALVDAEQDLRAAGLDVNQGLDHDAIGAYRTAVVSAIENQVALEQQALLGQEAREALLEHLVAIQRSGAPDEQRAATLKTFGSAIDERLYLGKPVDRHFLEQAQEAAVVAEAVLAQARLDQEKGIQPESMDAIKQAYRQIVSARLGVGRPLSQEQLRETLETLTAGMRWPVPTSDPEVEALKRDADQKATTLVDTLLDPEVSEAKLAQALQSAFTSSAKHTVARRRLGLELDGQPELAEDGSRNVGTAEPDEPEEMLEDFASRLKPAIAGLTPEQAQAAYDRLMDPDRPARSLLVAAGLLGHTRALTGDTSQDGLAALERIYRGEGCLPRAINALGERAGKPFDRKKAKPGEQEGKKVNPDLRELWMSRANAFYPDSKARAFLRNFMPPGTRYENVWLIKEAAAREKVGDRDYMAIKNARVDPDAPRLSDDDWDKLKLGRDGGALERAKDAILDNWPRSHAELTCLHDFEEPRRDARIVEYHAAERPLSIADILDKQAPGPANPLLGGRPTLAGSDSGDDSKDQEKGGGNV